MTSHLSYVLITPARNEAQFIELTIKSVVAQTSRPLKWVIVSDGSTDGTDEIVRRYTTQHAWIELVRRPERQDRHFAGKAHAFHAGYEKVTNLPYEIIGNLDADLTFEPDHLAYLLSQFVNNSKLGVAGSSYEDVRHGARYDYRFANPEDVPGACQLFRRECFEAIGGYPAIKGGNLDTIASMSARMKGWETRTFTEKPMLHYRESGTAESNVLRARFKKGVKAYAMGNHPVFEIFRIVYQMTKSPLLVGGLASLCGYAWSSMKREPRPVPGELVAFRRREQMQRLRRVLSGQWILHRM